MFYFTNRFLYISSLLLLPLVFCNAQTDNTSRKISTSLSGRISDSKTGATLPGASVFINDLNKGTVSKEDGSYMINNIPPGKYLVEVSYVGYSSNAQTIDTRQTTHQDFTLEQTAVEKEAVTVTGVSSATRIKQN